MEFLNREECLSKLREYIYSGKKTLKTPELTPNFLGHVYELLWLERSLFFYGGASGDGAKRSLKVPFQSMLELVEALLLWNTTNFIPTNTLAAFLKRLLRIAVQGGCLAFQMWLVPFLFNVFKKYGTCILFLIHAAEPGDVLPPTKLVSTDPFLETEHDPTKTQAMQSSLWEVELLTRHYFPKVASFTQILHENFKGRQEFGLDKYARKTDAFYLQEVLELAAKEQQRFDAWPLAPILPDDILWT